MSVLIGGWNKTLYDVIAYFYALAHIMDNACKGLRQIRTILVIRTHRLSLVQVRPYQYISILFIFLEIIFSAFGPTSTLSRLKNIFFLIFLKVFIALVDI